MSILNRVSLGIVTRDSSVLLVERSRAEKLDNGELLTWAFPGGKQRLSEPTGAACEREVYEETGYRVRARHLIDRSRQYAAGVILSYWECELLSQEPQTVAVDPAIRQVQWVPIEVLDTYITSTLNPAVAKFLSRV